MNSIKLFILVAIGFFSVSNLQAQGHLISEGGTVITCADSLFDTGDQTADYADGENFVFTFCSDGTGNVITTEFGLGGAIFDIAVGDVLNIYDGNTTGAPLLGAFDNTNVPVGIKTTTSNASGCMTFEFVSNSDGTVGEGFEVHVGCLTECQPIEPIISSLTHNVQIFSADSIIIDACLDDSISFVVQGSYPDNGVNPNNYAQSDATSDFAWDFGDANTSILSSAYNIYTVATGYIVELSVTDANGCAEAKNILVRIGGIPIFGDIPELSVDTICLGDTITLLGAFDASDDIDSSAFFTSEITGGGIDDNFFELPDGGGVNHSNTITINGFGTNTITSATDVVSICVDMEHSYLGDLEMWLECPNGTEVNLFNSYSPGTWPGGFGGGNTFMGDPFDNDGPTRQPGDGFTYCWSSTATLGTFATEYNSNTVTLSTPTNNSSGTSVAAGTYQPEGSFNDFVGCPINGDWTLTIRDNISADNGYVFGWGCNFQATQTNFEPYTVYAQEGDWLQDSTFVSSDPAGTLVAPAAFGDNDYTFQMIDAFGCEHDTTMSVYVRPYPIINPYTPTCDLEYQFTNTQNATGGVWTATGPGNISFIPSDTDLNPMVTADEYGMYTFSFLESTCAQGIETKILFVPDVSVSLDSARICGVDPNVTFDATFSEDSSVSYLWSPGGETTSRISVHDEGTYEVTVSGLCNTDFATTFLKVDTCTVLVPNIITPNGDATNSLLVVEHLDRHPNSSIVIFNRWGKVVYENENYQNDWTGTNKNGKDLGEGVYYYVLSNPANRFETLKGHVTIAR